MEVHRDPAAGDAAAHRLAQLAVHQGEDVDAIRAFNDFVAKDPRVEAVMLTIGDGLTLLRKKG